MTREDAKQWIHRKFNQGEAERLMADLVIKALEQEPCEEYQMRNATPEEQKSIDDYIKSISKPTGVNFWDLEQEPCSDAVSRQAVMDCLTATGLKQFDFILDARDKIKNLPSVNPQEQTGHWIDTGSGQECSKCHEIQYGYDNHRFYCANCGAKMEREDNA